MTGWLGLEAASCDRGQSTLELTTPAARTPDSTCSDDDIRFSRKGIKICVSSSGYTFYTRITPLEGPHRNIVNCLF